MEAGVVHLLLFRGQTCANCDSHCPAADADVWAGPREACVQETQQQNAEEAVVVCWTERICALHTKDHQHTQSTILFRPSRSSDEMPSFCVRQVPLPFAWQKGCVISDKVRNAPEAMSSRLSSPFNFLNISIPPLSHPLPSCHLWCWGNMRCLLSRSPGHRLLHLSCCWWWWWGAVLCTVCLCGAGAAVGGGGCCKDWGTWFVGRCRRHLHFWVSFTPLSSCWKPLQPTVSLPLSRTHTNKHAHKISTSTNTKRFLIL